MGAGVMVVLKSGRVSAPLDLAVADTLGPWTPSDNSLESRRLVQKSLDNARMASMDHFFNLTGLSFDEQSTRVIAALRSRLGMPTNSYYPMPGGDLYIPANGLHDDWVVYCIGGQHYGLAYSIDAAGNVTFEGEPTRVRQGWESIDDEDKEPIELRQTPWFKKYMASKKKMLGSLPSTPEMPSSLPNLPSAGGQTTDMPGSPKNIR